MAELHVHISQGIIDIVDFICGINDCLFAFCFEVNLCHVNYEVTGFIYFVMKGWGRRQLMVWGIYKGCTGIGEN